MSAFTADVSSEETFDVMFLIELDNVHDDMLDDPRENECPEFVYKRFALARETRPWASSSAAALRPPL